MTAQCRMSPPKQRSRQKCHPFSTEVTLRVKTYTKDGSIEKVTEAQECNRSSEQDVTVLRGRWGDNEMEEKKRNKCFQFLKHLWRPMPIMI